MKIWHYAIIVFLGGCCYGVLSTFVKLAYASGFSMAEVTGGQFLFGTIFIWLVFLFTRKNKILIDKMLLLKIIISGFPMGLTGIFYYKSLQSVDASLAIIFLFQFVWIGTVIEWAFYKKRPDRNKIISIIVLLFGSVLAAGFVGNGLEKVSLAGGGWGMLSACSFSTFIVVSGAVGNDVPPIFKSALLSSGALILVMILFPPLFIFQFPMLIELAPYASLLGLFGVLLPPLLFSIGMPHVGPGLGTILSASELPIAVIMSAIILREQVALFQWFGVILIMAGIVFGNAVLLRLKEETT